MNVILQSNESIIRELKPQYKSKHKNYRFLKYCVFQDIDGGKLIWNTLTKSLVWIKDSEYENVIDDWDDRYDYIDFLVKNYFIVPEDFNELEVVDVLRKHRQPIMTDNWLESPTGFTILTTTQCNARCFYCYENPVQDKKHMTKKTAKKVVKYIDRVAPHKNIKLRWFGGEPLYNSEIIDYISERLASLGYNFEGSIISNGYLFDKATCEKAKYVWRFNSVQITLDGTEEIYNKTKRYIYKDDPNPFGRVIENIQNLLDLEINVSIRMNCDKHNAEDLKELVKFLREKFQNNPRLHVYAYPLFELNGFQRTEEYRKLIFDKLEEIEQTIEECGFPAEKRLDAGDMRAIHCMVDTGQDVLISTEGDLGLCEHYITEDFWGHIDDPNKKDWDIIKSWTQYSKPLEICNDCPLYPTCIKSVKCPDCNICDENWYKREVNHLKASVKEHYLNWKKSFEKPQSCEVSQTICKGHTDEVCNGNMVQVFESQTVRTECKENTKDNYMKKLIKKIKKWF